MIIGGGDVASVLPKRDDLLFFASGVSNSQCTDEAQYQREIDLLNQQDRSKHIVYFSTLSVFYSKGRYAQHKSYMEELIKQFPTYTIVRIGNILWGTNPHTLINFFRAHPDAQVRNEYRYIIDKDEFLHHINLIPEWSCEYNITGRRMKIQEIVDEYCFVGIPVK